MLSKHSKQKLSAYGEQFVHGKEVVFDSSVFDDPVALQTRWGGLALGGSSSRAVKQVISSDRRQISYRPTPGSLLFVVMFTLACPLTWLFLESPLMGSGKLIGDGLTTVLGVFSVIFFIAGVAWLKSLLTAKTMDLGKRVLTVGRHKSPLDTVHAIQIVPEKVKLSRSTGDPGSRARYYISFELNLVFKDASRVNLMDHADYNDIRESADELSSLLGLPLWDMVEKDERF